MIFLPGVRACTCYPLLFLLTALLLGCGPRWQVTAVSGTVTLDGKPLEDGKISFRSTTTSTPPQIGNITAGQFACQVTTGPQRVEISATRTIPGAASTGIGEANYIPPRYNTQSTLTVEVTASGPNSFTFDLKSN